MKSLLASLAVLLIGGSASAATYPTNGAVTFGTGNSRPSGNVRKSATSDRSYMDVAVVRNIIYNSATPITAGLYGTATPTVVSTGDWIDTSCFSQMTLVIRINGGSTKGSATLTVYSTATSFGGSNATPYHDHVGVSTDTIVATADTVTVTNLGPWTRVELTTNVGGAGNINSATISADSVFRYY